MIEEWRDIEGYEGLYQASNLGRIKSLDRVIIRRNGKNIHIKERIIKYTKTGYEGYWCVHLYKDKKSKTLSVHRLIANAFISNPHKLPEVNHKDECKINNCVDNLEWCSREYNQNYGTAVERGRINRGKKVECIETGIIYQSLHDAMIQTNIDCSTICGCCKGKYKTAGGYHWKYAC